MVGLRGARARSAPSPAPVRNPAVRKGFGLAELIVSLVLLSVGVLGISAAGAAGARLHRQAEAEEDALAATVTVLDSLLQVETPTSGTRSEGRAALSWIVRATGRASAIDMTVRYDDGSAQRILLFSAVQLPSPPASGSLGG